jgi:hypothetical protein
VARHAGRVISCVGLGCRRLVAGARLTAFAADLQWREVACGLLLLYEGLCVNVVLILLGWVYF